MIISLNARGVGLNVSDVCLGLTAVLTTGLMICDVLNKAPQQQQVRDYTD
jgi:hypothetical protein